MATDTYVARGLVFLNNRHYDPSTGVFISVDPLVEMTEQPYIYGGANPVTYSDPSGLCIVPGSFSVAADGTYTYTQMGGTECYNATAGSEDYVPDGGYGQASVPGPVSTAGTGFTGLDPTPANVALVGVSLYGGAFLASHSTWRTAAELLLARSKAEAEQVGVEVGGVGLKVDGHTGRFISRGKIPNKTTLKQLTHEELRSLSRLLQESIRNRIRNRDDFPTLDQNHETRIQMEEKLVVWIQKFLD